MSITAERLMVEVQADVRQALAKMTQVERQAESTAGRMSKMARSMGVAFGGAAIASGIGKTINLAMSFDATMRQIGVQTDSTGQSLTKLGDLALKMGKDTVFSAQDASGAMLGLAKGGLTAAQIRAGALESTLKLAAAGGLDLANAADYVTQGMTTFGLGAGAADKIVTALAGGANASTASVESLGMALSQVGPGATNAQMSIQETVAALAAFDNAGIKGSDAGTSLKTMLSSLVPATEKASGAMAKYGLDFVDAEGNFISMTGVAQELKEGLGDLSAEERTRALRTIFGSDATRAATVMMRNGEKGLGRYLKATKDTSKAQEMANSAMEGAKGAWENFKGSVETAAIQVGTKLLPAFTDAAEGGADLVDTMMGWGPEIQSTFGWVPGLFRSTFSALEPVVDLVQAAASAWSDLPGPVKSLTGQVVVAALVFPRLAAAATTASASVMGSFTTMSARARQFGAEMTYASTRTAALGRVAKTAAGPAGMAAMMVGASSANEGVKALSTTLGAAAIGFSMGGPLGAAIGGLGGGFMALKGHSDRTRTAIEKTYSSIQEAGGPVKSAKASLDDLRETLDQVTGAYTGATRASVLQRLETAGLVDAGNAAGVSSRELVNAAMGQAGAWSRVRGVVSQYESKIAETTTAMKELQAELRADMEAGRGRSDAKVKEIYALDAQRVALRKNIATLKQMPGELRAQGEEVRKTAQATADYSGKLKGIPRKARTAIQAEGIAPTVKGVADLAQRYNLLDKKKVRTLVEATGADLSVRKIMAVIEKAKELAKQTPKPKVDADTTRADKKAKLVQDYLLKLSGYTATPKADLKDNASAPLRNLSTLVKGLDGSQIVITTVHRTVGTPGGGGGGGGGGTPPAGRQPVDPNALPGYSPRMALKPVQDAVEDWVKKLSPQGQKLAEALVGGFSGSADQIVAQIDRYADKVSEAYDDQMERATEAYDRRRRRAEKKLKGKAERSKLNSLDAAEEGRLDALAKERDRILKAAQVYSEKVSAFRGVVANLGEGLGESWDQAQDQMAEVRKSIQATFTGKAEARWLKVVDAANNQLAGLYSRRAALAEQLEEANRKVADLQQAKASFRDSVFGGMDSQATVLNAGNTAGAIAGNLQAQVAKVQQFAGMLSQLRGMGFSDAVVMQVASAGVEGGMNAAKALVAANAGEVSTINGSMAAITATAAGTADALAGGMYDAGISAAQGIANGIQSQLTTTVAQINQVAYALHQAMQAELRTGMTDGGRQAAQGLINGLKDKRGPLREAAEAIGKEMIRALKDELKIASPSKVTRSLGRFVPQGLALGIRDDVKKVGKATRMMSAAAVPTLDTPVTSTAQLHGGQRAGASVSFNFVSHNPLAEPQSQTTNRALAQVAALSLV